MWLYILLAFSTLILYLYFKVTREYGSFEAHGIPEAPKYFPFGSVNQWEMFTGKRSFVTLLDGIYDPKKPFVGLFAFSQPILAVNDLDMIRNVLVKDFDHFVDRRSFELDDKKKSQQLFSRMMTVLNGDKWKAIRNTMSPVFTSGKLKTMTPLIYKVTDEFVNHLEDYSKSGEQFLGKDMMTTYALDSIASCGFGVESNSFKDKDSIFRKMVFRAIGQGGSKLQFIKLLLIIGLPKVAKMLQLDFFDEESLLFFNDVVVQSMKHRKNNQDKGPKRNDLIDLCVEALEEAKANGFTTKQIVEDGQYDKDALIANVGNAKFTEEEFEQLIVANALVLFFAGFDTSSTILGVTLGYLAKNPDVQEKLFQEINDAFESEGTQHLDYTTVQGLPYLEMVVLETLRFYPLAMLERKCVKDYPVPGTSYVLKKGLLIQIPGSAIHHDPRFYADPDNFNPEENMNKEARSNRNPYAFLSFGQGPRNCIGMRFALLLVKIALVRMVGNFKIGKGSKMPEVIEVDPMSQSAQPKGGVWVTVEKRS